MKILLIILIIFLLTILLFIYCAFRLSSIISREEESKIYGKSYYGK